MKLSSAPRDDWFHMYCMRCRQETVREHKQSGRTIYTCDSCQLVHPRALIFDPAIIWWLGDDGEYWHETAGVFVRNAKDEFLFFERMKFPFGLTVPAGHVDSGEEPIRTVRRELIEETGLRVPRKHFRLFAVESLRGDQCRRGSDAHRWNTYAVRVRNNAPIKVSPDEATRPVWLTLGQALQRDLTPVVRLIITRHTPAILAASR